MKVDPERLATLPKWAQAYARNLTERLAAASKELALARGAQRSSVEVDPDSRMVAGRTTGTYLPDSASVRWTFPDGTWIDVRIDRRSGAGLQVFASGQLRIVPHVTNNVSLSLEGSEVGTYDAT